MIKLLKNNYSNNKTHQGGFILLEVIICLIILSVTLGTLMRSFTLSLKAIRKAEVATVGSFLAEELMEQYEVFPPKAGETSDTFESKGEKYARYYYKTRLKEEQIDYEGFTLEGDFKELESLYYVTIEVYYDDPTYEKILAAKVETYLLGAERFTYSSKLENALF